MRPIARQLTILLVAVGPFCGCRTTSDGGSAVASVGSKKVAQTVNDIPSFNMRCTLASTIIDGFDTAGQITNIDLHKTNGQYATTENTVLHTGQKARVNSSGDTYFEYPSINEGKVYKVMFYSSQACTGDVHGSLSVPLKIWGPYTSTHSKTDLVYVCDGTGQLPYMNDAVPCVGIMQNILQDIATAREPNYD